MVAIEPIEETPPCTDDDIETNVSDVGEQSEPAADLVADIAPSTRKTAK